MANERGSILSKIILIPVGVVLMVGFFFLGYQTGKYQNRSMATPEIAVPLPEPASSAGQNQEEFTFYKTLTGNNDKMVSIDLKPQPGKEEGESGKQHAAAETRKATPPLSAPKEERTEIKIEKAVILPVKSEQTELKQPQPLAKKEPPSAITDLKIRYTVQTASYQEKGMAEEEAKRLKKRGYAAFVASADIPGKGVWHRVRLGSFIKKEAAEKLQKTLHAKEGISPIVVVE